MRALMFVYLKEVTAKYEISVGDEFIGSDGGRRLTGMCSRA